MGKNCWALGQVKIQYLLSLNLTMNTLLKFVCKISTGMNLTWKSSGNLEPLMKVFVVIQLLCDNILTLVEQMFTTTTINF